MGRSHRDLMLFLLAVAAGSADGWSYFGLGHAFVANMTGNTVLLGIAVFLHGDMLHPCISLLSYLAGAALAAFLTRNSCQGGQWSRAVSRTLAVESALLIGIAIEWSIISGDAMHPGSNPRLNVLLGCVAVAIGLQSGAMLQLRIPGVVTTYITGTWTNLMSGAARFLANESEEPVQEKAKQEETLVLQSGVLGAYFISAMITGVLFRYARGAVGTLPAISVLLVAIGGQMQKHTFPE